MQYLKILTYAVVLLIPAFQLFRDWKYSDKRTKKHHQFTRALLMIWIISGIASAIFYSNNLSTAKIQSEDLKKQIGSLQKSNEEQIKNNRELSGKLDNLVSINEELKERLQPYEKFVETIYPGLEKEKAFEKLKEDFYSFKSRTEIEENTIRKFEANLNVTFSGKWTSSPSSMIPISLGSPKPWYMSISATDPAFDNPIKLFPKDKFRFEDIDSDTVSFVSQLEIMKGQYPLGKSIDEFSKFTRIRIWIPTYFSKGKIKDQQIFIDEIRVVFFVNNKDCVPFLYNPPASFRVPLNEKGWAIFDYKTKDFIKTFISFEKS